MREFEFRDSPALSARAVAYLDTAESDRVVVPPRRAATVMLLRDRDTTPESHRGGVDVFIMRRVAAMEFAPGSVVFPGGAVDSHDDRDDLPWAGPSAAEWGVRLGCDPAAARLAVAAAIREVFEECGVLLASHSPDDDLYAESLTTAAWEAARHDLVARSVTLHDVLVAAGLVMRTDVLAPMAHWITPEFEARRYDTVFFAARMPSSQEAHHVSTEADRAEWADPAQVLADHASGAVTLLPPTVVALEHLCTLRTVDDLVAPGELVAVRPQVHRQADGRLVIRA